MHAEPSQITPQPDSPSSHSHALIATTLRFGYGLRLRGAPTALNQYIGGKRYSCDTNAGRFVLRSYAATTDTRALTRSLALVEALANSGFPAAAPLPAHDGELIVLLGEHPAALFYAIEGEPLAATARDIRDQGHALGCMHRLYGFEDNGSLRRVLPGLSIEARLERLPVARLTQPQRVCVEGLRERNSYLQLPLTLEQGVVQGPIGLEQLVRSVEGEVALRDSDVLAYGPRLLDVALLIARLCVAADGLVLHLWLCELIAGYSQGLRRKLWLDEWQALPLLIYYAALLLSAEQIAALGTSGDTALPPAWQLAQAIEARWDDFAGTITALGIDQLAPERSP
jgi:hypothetical protein